MMEPTLITLSAELEKKNIRLSYQRLKVLEYLSKNKNHPTVDQIYNDLVDDVPTLSKTTVYNTLDALIDAKLARLITIEDNETRYDINTRNHGHFKCESCGTIYDFSIDIDNVPVRDLENFKVHDKNVYFKGICTSCLSK